MNLRWNKDKFVEASVEIHGSLFDYSNVEWKTITSKVEIICPVHGSFWQVPDKHLNGQGCKHCRGSKISSTKRKTLEQFKIDANKLHSNKYSYEITTYRSTHTKVDILCKEHGVFKQTPASHLSGKGCPACNSTGFISNKPANFYIATNGYLTKVGITNKHPNTRLANVSKSAKSEFELIEYFNFEDGSQALALETSMLKNLRATYEQCPTWFDGSSECFINVSPDFISNNVSKFLLAL